MMLMPEIWNANIMRIFRRWGVSLSIALLLLLADYLLENMTFPILDESESLEFAVYIKDRLRFRPDEEMTSVDEWIRSNGGPDKEDSLFCVNVGVDKQLLPVTDEFGDTIGRTVVTDRNALLRFLEIARNSRYRYIFIDIRFEKGLTSDVDSALFSTISSMRNVSVSAHRQSEGFEVADTVLRNKLVMSDYRFLASSGFSRYEYIQDGAESAGLRMYRELQGKTVRKNGLIYSSDGSLCHNMQFLQFSPSDMSGVKNTGEIRFPYLSAQVMGMHSDEELRGMLDGKIILIGDFDNDRHHTYAGEVPGPLFAYKAYQALTAGEHKVKWEVEIFLFVLYVIICYILLNSVDPLKHIPVVKRIKAPMLKLLITLAGWGMVLTIVKYTLYLFYGVSMETLLPSVVFSLISTVKSYRNLKKLN